ncbi:type VI secretion system baseplate subunit TssF [Utexia brackfieldae]|uniref:type VI secretion system baseplate subunit TssF n=1 Tax=Utexia brackfieldae TaxID=3074108 RepID=UPI00370DBB37
MDLKDYFRDELNYLRALAKAHSKQNSLFQDFLTAFDNEGDIEFLFENFAFLMAKLRQQVDDAFPQITQNLLSRVWPTPIRPLPSTAILKFCPKSADIHQISAGSTVKSQAIAGEYALFRTVREIAVIPLEVKSCHLQNSPTACKMSLTLIWHGSLTDNQIWSPLPIPFLLSADTQLAGLLQLWFQQYLCQVSVSDADQVYALPCQVVQNFQPAPDKLVLPLAIKLFWRLQLLQEYFHLPHVNDFMTIDLSAALTQLKLDETRSFTLTFQFDTPLLIDDPLDNQSAFLTNCVPVINLYPHHTPMFAFHLGQSDYRLDLANGKRIYQINAVYSPLEPAYRSERGDNIQYWPITQFTAHHFGADNPIFYQTMFRSNVVGQPEHIMTFIDSQGERVTEFSQQNYLCDLLATDGDKAAKLQIGDINLPTLSITNNLKFHNITRPTPEILPLLDSERHWSMISHFSLSPLFIKDMAAIKQLISDFNYHGDLNVPFKQRIDKQLQGLIAMDAKLIDWIFDGVMKRGIEMTVTCDPSHFVNEGEMYRFGFILANVLPFCLTSNNFLMMKIVNSQTGRIWVLAPIRGSREQI